MKFVFVLPVVILSACGQEQRVEPPVAVEIVGECEGEGKVEWLVENGHKRTIISRDDFAEECVP